MEIQAVEIELPTDYELSDLPDGLEWQCFKPQKELCVTELLNSIDVVTVNGTEGHISYWETHDNGNKFVVSKFCMICVK